MEVKERSIHIHPELFHHSVKPRDGYSLFVKLGVCASVLLKELNVLNFCFGKKLRGIKARKIRSVVLSFIFCSVATYASPRPQRRECLGPCPCALFFLLNINSNLTKCGFFVCVSAHSSEIQTFVGFLYYTPFDTSTQ